MTVTDRSNYFKGLLLLISKDHKISPQENRILKSIGKALGFDPTFCENAINEILENTFIANTAPEFSARDVAEGFIRDGLTLALCDSDLHPSELRWLRLTVEKNRLDPGWFRSELDQAVARTPDAIRLEVNQLSVNSK